MADQPMMRLAVDAVIERDGKLLLIEYADARLGRHWGLPGGGQRRAIHTPSVPDLDQIGVAWVAIADLAAIAFFPRIAARLQKLLIAPPPLDIFIIDP